jgi:lia operon protein LiaF
MKFRIWGLTLMGLGVLALLQGIGVYNFGLAFWPVVLVLAGGALIWGSLNRGGAQWVLLGLGLWAGGIGLFEILANAGVTLITGQQIFRHGWPILLVALGISLIFGRCPRFSVHKGGRFDPELRGCGKTGGESWHHIGDLYHGREPWLLEGDLNLQHDIGDIVLDLSTASFGEGTHQIKVGAKVGELQVRVPDHVNAIVDASVKLGELELFGEKRSGIGGLVLHQEQLHESSPVRLEIEARLKVGSLKVIRVPASPGSSR